MIFPNSVFLEEPPHLVAPEQKSPLSFYLLMRYLQAFQNNWDEKCWLFSASLRGSSLSLHEYPRFWTRQNVLNCNCELPGRAEFLTANNWAGKDVTNSHRSGILVSVHKLGSISLPHCPPFTCGIPMGFMPIINVIFWVGASHPCSSQIRGRISINPLW